MERASETALFEAVRGSGASWAEIVDRVRHAETA